MKKQIRIDFVFFALIFIIVTSIVIIKRYIQKPKVETINAEDMLTLPDHNFFCDKLNFSFQRCYNDEVICYKYIGRNRGGLTCKWKKD